MRQKENDMETAQEDCRRTVRPTGILWENRSNDQQSDHKEKVKAG